MKWELVKYKIRDFSIGSSKKIAKQNREKTALLEEIVSDFESKTEFFSTYTEDEFLQAKNELELIYENKTKGYILRSKCQWYEEGEKSSKYFLNLEKVKAKKSIITKLVGTNGEEHTDKKKHFKKH